MNSKELAQQLYTLAKSHNWAARIVVEAFETLKQRSLGYMVPHVAKSLVYLLQQEQKQQTVMIETAHAMPHDCIEAIKQSVGAGAEISHNVKTNESLLGGFKATYQNSIIDHSLKSKLQTLETVLTK